MPVLEHNESTCNINGSFRTINKSLHAQFDNCKMYIYLYELRKRNFRFSKFTALIKQSHFDFLPSKPYQIEHFKVDEVLE